MTIGTISRLSILLAVFVFLAAPLFAATFSVNNSATQTGCGVTGAASSNDTIQQVITMTSNWDTIIVCGGNYSITVPIDINKSITITGNGSNIINITPAAGIDAIVVNASNVNITNLTVKGTGFTNAAFNISSVANVSIIGAVAYDVGTGFAVYNAANVNITNATTLNTTTAFNLSMVNDSVIANSTIRNNTFGVNAYSTVNNLTVTNNTFANSTAEAAIGSATAISIGTNITSSTFSYNFIRGSETSYGVNIYGDNSTSNTIQRNVFANIYTAVSLLYGNGTWIDNNSIIDGRGLDFIRLPGQSDIIISNNSFVNLSDFGGYYGAILVSSSNIVRLQIINNTFTNIDDFAIQLPYSNTNTTILNNTITGSTSSGINLTSATTPTVSYNILSGNSREIIITGSSSGGTVASNVLSISQTGATIVNSSNVVFQNNSVTGGTSGTAIGVYVYNTTGVNVTNTSLSNYTAGINVTNSTSPFLANNSIWNSTWSIFVSNVVTSLVVANNSIKNVSNDGYAIYVGTNVASPVIGYNHILGANTQQYGIVAFEAGTSALTIRNNVLINTANSISLTYGDSSWINNNSISDIGSSGGAITLGALSSVIVSNNTVSNISTGVVGYALNLASSGATGTLVVNNTFINPSYEGVHAGSSNTNTQVMNNTITGAASAGINLTEATTTTVTYNYMSNNSIDVLLGRNTVGATVASNTLFNSAYGYYLTAMSNSSISGGTIYDGTGYGAYVESSSGVNLTGATFRNITTGGVYVNSSNSTLVKALTVNSSKSGISVNKGTSSTVRDSVVYNQTYVGILLAAEASSTVTNNSVFTISGGTGISLNTTNLTTVSNNTVYNVSTGLYSSTNNATVSSTLAYENVNGVYCRLCNDTNFSSNTAWNNTVGGIYLSLSKTMNLTSQKAYKNFHGYVLNDSTGIELWSANASNNSRIQYNLTNTNVTFGGTTYSELTGSNSTISRDLYASANSNATAIIGGMMYTFATSKSRFTFANATNVSISVQSSSNAGVNTTGCAVTAQTPCNLLTHNDGVAVVNQTGTTGAGLFLGLVFNTTESGNVYGYLGSSILLGKYSLADSGWSQVGSTSALVNNIFTDTVRDSITSSIEGIFGIYGISSGTTGGSSSGTSQTTLSISASTTCPSSISVTIYGVNNAVDGVTVSVRDSSGNLKGTATTDSLGKASVAVGATGTYTITASKSGYLDGTKSYTQMACEQPATTTPTTTEPSTPPSTTEPTTTEPGPGTTTPSGTTSAEAQAGVVAAQEAIQAAISANKDTAAAQAKLNSAVSLYAKGDYAGALEASQAALELAQNAQSTKQTAPTTTGTTGAPGTSGTTGTEVPQPTEQGGLALGLIGMLVVGAVVVVVIAGGVYFLFLKGGKKGL